MKKILRKRTKALLLLTYVCVALFLFFGYEDFRRDQEIRADWRGQEPYMEAMELPPGPSRSTKALLIASASLSIAAVTYVIIDFRNARR